MASLADKSHQALSANEVRILIFDDLAENQASQRPGSGSNTDFYFYFANIKISKCYFVNLLFILFLHLNGHISLTKIVWNLSFCIYFIISPDASLELIFKSKFTIYFHFLPIAQVDSSTAVDL